MDGPNRTIAVLTGGFSYEREVSLTSGQRIADELRAAGHQVFLHDVTPTLLDALIVDKPEVVVIALHGAGGEDGALREVLELLHVPYVGANAIASRLSWDKTTAKSLWKSAGLTTPKWITLPQQLLRELGAGHIVQLITEQLGLPLVVKPLHGGSGLGVRNVHSEAELPAALMSALSYDSSVIIEQFISGIDIAVSVVELGDDLRALPIVEIDHTGSDYDYPARYMAGHNTWHVPARLSEQITSSIGELAITAHRTLGLRDLSRVDMIVTQEGIGYLLGAKVVPGMTETSLLPLAAESAGLSLGKLFSELIEQAIARGH